MIVTLNISNHSVKVLSVKGRQVRKWGNLSLTQGQVRDGQINESKAVGEAIASLFKSTGIPKEKVITSLAGLSYTYRFVNLPKMKPAMLDEAVLRAARKEMSLSLDELYLSWQLLPGKGEEQTYFVLGIPRNPIDALEETLKIGGIEPYLVDLQPLALARAANKSDAIIVNIEPDCFDIVFMAGGIPAVIHTINPRSEEATLEDNIRRLADELTKTAAFYQNRNPQSPLSPSTPLLLTGDLALDLPASGLLQTEIEYPIEPLKPPLEYPPELPVASYTVNMGLSLKKTTPKSVPSGDSGRYNDININILSGKYRKVRAKPKSVKMILFAALVAVAIISLFPLYQARNQIIAEKNIRQEEYSSISRELNLANLVYEESIQIEEDIEQIKTNNEALKAANQYLLSTRGEITRNLSFVTGTLPPFTNFTSIEMNKSNLTVRGETDSVFTAINYAIALEAVRAFSEVRITELDESTSVIPGDDASQEKSIIVNHIVFRIILSK